MSLFLSSLWHAREQSPALALQRGDLTEEQREEGMRTKQQENSTGEDRSTMRAPSCRGTNPPNPLTLGVFLARGGKTKSSDAPQRHTRVSAPLQRKFGGDDVPAQRVKSEVKNQSVEKATLGCRCCRQTRGRFGAAPADSHN